MVLIHPSCRPKSIILFAQSKLRERRIYIWHLLENDLDSDCGKRRNKRDKSFYVIGYRLHTLTAINPETGHSFPLVSVVGAANQPVFKTIDYDSLFLKPLIKLAQALGIDMKLITADQAYHDSNGSVLKETGVYVVAPASEKAKLPDNVLDSPLRVTCDDSCEIPMEFIGATPEGHEFGCAANPGECIFESTCPKRPFDQELLVLTTAIFSQCQLFIIIPKKQSTFGRTVNVLSI